MDNALRSDILPTAHAHSNVENRTKYHHLNVSVAHVQTEMNAQNSHFRHEVLASLCSPTILCLFSHQGQ